MSTDLQHIIEGAAKDDNVDVVVQGKWKTIQIWQRAQQLQSLPNGYRKSINPICQRDGQSSQITFLGFPISLISACQGGVIGFFFPLLSVFEQVYIMDDQYFFATMLLFQQCVERLSSYTFPWLFGHEKSLSQLVNSEKLAAAEAMQFGLLKNASRIKKNCTNLLFVFYISKHSKIQWL